MDLVAAYAESDLEAVDEKDLKEHVERVSVFFGKILSPGMNETGTPIGRFGFYFLTAGNEDMQILPQRKAGF